MGGSCKLSIVYETYQTLLDQYPDVDGIMALDLCAAAFLKTEKNKKILAYDGTYATDFNYHSIDSIVQDAKKVAKESVNMLIKLINDQRLRKGKYWFL